MNKTFHESYLRKHYPTIIIEPYRTTKNMVDAIENNEIAAFFAVPYLTSRILTTMGLTGAYDRMDERHGRQQFRAGVLKNNQRLLHLVDEGFSQISHEELVEIEERWIPNPRERIFSRQDKQIRLTLTEEEWLGDHPIWCLAIAEHREPYTIIKKNQAASGIIFDYLEILSKRLGVIMEPHIIPQSEFRNGLLPKQCDIVVGMEPPERHHNLIFTDKLLTVSHVIVNRMDEPYIDGIDAFPGRTVSAVNNTVVFDHIQSAFPNIRLIGAKNVLEALNTTSTGTSAATICDLTIAGHLIADNRLANLKIAAPFQAPEVSLRFGMAKAQPTLSLLNKAIHSISPEEHEQINQKWHQVRYEKGFDWQIVIKWALIISGIFLLILCIILYWNRRLAIEVTERKKAETALKESQERYRGIFEATKSGVAVYQAVDAGKDFIFKKFNPSAERIEAIGKEAVIGQRVSIIFPGYKDIGLLDLFRQVYQTGEPKGHPISLYKDERITGWREHFVYKLPSGEIVTVYSDETKRKTDEAEKERLTAQLHQSQKMETIGTLAGGIAHDFNNILGMVMGNIELAIEDCTDPKAVVDRMTDAQKACIRAKNVVRQLLRFSRQGDEKKQPIRLDDLIRDSQKMIRSLFPATIDIQMEIIVQSGMLLGDTTQMHQLLLNLCTNAAHAMEGTGGRLSIRLSEVYLNADDVRQLNNLPPGDYLKLTIRDTGTGLDPIIQNRIFDPYFTTKDVGKGTGMGLAIVSGVVRNHNGFITVDSKPGKGTIFTILLPVYLGEKPAALVDPQVDYRGSEKILLVDDEPMIVQVQKEILEKLGYSVTVKENPIEALQLFKHNDDAYDLVITDMTMPKMTGEQLAAEILAIRPDMPIILCSGFCVNMTCEKAAHMGISQYMEKPLRKDQLALTVRQVLDRSKKKITKSINSGRIRRIKSSA